MEFMRSIYFLIFSLTNFNCQRTIPEPLILRKIEFNKNIEIDTIGSYLNDSILLVQIVDFQNSVDNFKTDCGFIRKFESTSIIYKIENFSPFRISNEFIAQVSSEYATKVNWGWFYINKNGFFDTLPNQNAIYDSLTSQFSNDYFTNYNENGDFWVLKNGITVKEYNYGNIIMKDSSIAFENIPFGLYKMQINKLEKISEDPININKNEEGLYFVPRPGLGVIRKYKIFNIIDLLKSYPTFSKCPGVIEFFE